MSNQIINIVYQVNGQGTVNGKFVELTKRNYPRNFKEISDHEFALDANNLASERRYDCIAILPPVEPENIKRVTGILAALIDPEGEDNIGFNIYSGTIKNWDIPVDVWKCSTK